MQKIKSRVYNEVGRVGNMSLEKCYVDGKMTSKGRTFCKRILLKEALGGELSSDEIADAIAKKLAERNKNKSSNEGLF